MSAIAKDYPDSGSGNTAGWPERALCEAQRAECEDQYPFRRAAPVATALAELGSDPDQWARGPILPQLLLWLYNVCIAKRIAAGAADDQPMEASFRDLRPVLWVRHCATSCVQHRVKCSIGPRRMLRHCFRGFAAKCSGSPAVSPPAIRLSWREQEGERWRSWTEKVPFPSFAAQMVADGRAVAALDEAFRGRLEAVVRAHPVSGEEEVVVGRSSDRSLAVGFLEETAHGRYVARLYHQPFDDGIGDMLTQAGADVVSADALLVDVTFGRVAQSGMNRAVRVFRTAERHG